MTEHITYGEKTLWEKEKLLVTSNFSFSTVFSKYLYCRHVKTKACSENVYLIIVHVTNLNKAEQVLTNEVDPSQP